MKPAGKQSILAAELVLTSALSHPWFHLRSWVSQALVLAFLSALVTHPSALLADTKFLHPTLQLEARAITGQATLALAVTSAVAPDPLEIVDVGIPGPTSIRVEFVAGSPQKWQQSTLWLVQANVSGLPPGTNQTRFARVTVGKREELVEYTLCNIRSTFAWTLQAPPTPWPLAAGRSIPFSITVGPVPATGVHLVSCALVEKTSGRLLGCDRLKLCRASSGDCGTEFRLEAQTAHRFFLRVADAFQEPGNYSGTLTVSANEIVGGVLPTPIQLTLLSTTVVRKAVGALTILVGIAAAFWVTTYRRNKIARDQALIPAMLLDRKLRDLEAIIEKSPIPSQIWNPTKTCEQIKKLRLALTPSSLTDANFIPPSFPNPNLSTPTGVGYQTFLQSESDLISLLSAIVHEGLQVAWVHWDSANPIQKNAIQNILTEIDQLAATPELPLSQVQSEIQTYLGQLQEPVKSHALLLSAKVQAQRQPPSVEELNIDISRLNVYGWVAWLILTLLAGSLALIWTRQDFGVLSDYVQCFLWSFGISAIGQMTTLSTISSALGMFKS